jgi:cytochrome c-type biogenesis protein CcmH/NrfG
VKKSLAEMSGDVGEKTALSQLILAGFYEENNLLIDAISAYKEAIKLAPDVPSFQESYDEFLLRHNMK